MKELSDIIYFAKLHASLYGLFAEVTVSQYESSVFFIQFRIQGQTDVYACAYLRSGEAQYFQNRSILQGL
jgi:hypothetical protein